MFPYCLSPSCQVERVHDVRTWPAVAARLRRFLYANFRRARRVAVFVIGITMVVFGCVLFFTPGPAILVIPAGLAVLATEFLWARRLLRRFRHTAQSISNNHARFRGASGVQIISVALLCGAFVYQLGWCWLASVPQIVGNITNDDTFLYLEFARNTVKFGFPTFDGINETNGAQPLWGGMLVLLASFISDKTMLLRAMLSLCAALNVATGLVLLRGAARLRSRVIAAVVGVCWTCYMLGLSPSMLGMENSLHAFIAAFIILLLIGFYMRSSPPSWRQYFVFGLLLALNAGVRMDSAVISFVLGLAVVHRGAALGTRLRMSFWLVFSPAILAACAYYRLNDAYFGTGLPVSGLMKAFYAQHYLDGNSSWQWPFYVLGAVLKTLFAAPQWLLARFAPEGLESLLLGLALALVLIPLLLRFVAPRLVDRPVADCRLTKLCKVLMAATLIHMVFLSASILHFSIDQWYHSWLLLTWIMVLAWGADRWVHSPVLPHAARTGIMAALVLVLATAQGIAIHRQLTGREANALFETRLEVADWINHNVPRQAELAAWNAGQLAYFTEQPLINLDGLMNSPAYAAFIRAGGDVRMKIDELGIDAVVDYNYDDSSIANHRTWDENRSFRNVWNWEEVSVLHRNRARDGKEFYVLNLPGGEIPEGKEPTRRKP